MRALDRAYRRAAGNDDGAAALSPIATLKGAWKGTGKSCCLQQPGTFRGLRGGRCSRPGGDPCRPGSGWASDLGNDIGGNNDIKEPFAWAVTPDDKPIIGADTDGTTASRCIAGQMEKCYVQNAASSRQTIVAPCFVMSRVNDSRGAGGSPRRGDTRPRDRARADPGSCRAAAAGPDRQVVPLY